MKKKVSPINVGNELVEECRSTDIDRPMQLEEGQTGFAISVTACSARANCSPDTVLQPTDHTNNSLCETIPRMRKTSQLLNVLCHPEYKEGTTTSPRQVLVEAIERDFGPEAVKCVSLNADEIARHQLRDSSQNCTFSKAVCRVKGAKRERLTSPRVH